MRNAADPEGARVILVGRTGLDQSLRASPDLELLRVRTTLDAIGELAHPIDDDSPSRAVIVVGDQLGEAPTDDAALRDSRAAEFVRAARSIDPDVLVVGASDQSASPAYAATVRGASDILALLSADLGRADREPARVRPGPAHPNQTPSAVESLISSILRPASEPPTSSAHSRAASHTSPSAPTPAPSTPAEGPRIENDAPMVQALLRGSDILEAALILLRARIGSDKVSYITRQTAADAPMAPAGAAPVTWGDALFGWIVAPGVPAAALSHHATWLAGWLRLRDQQAELRTAAFRDPLTGAWNRRYFDRFLASAMEQCRATRRTMTLMVFDIDDFKKYNDRYGHAAGDEILAETVRLMTSVVRPSDRVCRIGGDEFGVIFFEPEGPREQNSRHPDSVCKIAERFQQQIGRHRFPKLGSEAPGSLTISGGLATFPWDGATVEQLMARADERSMESKKCGKNALTLGPSAIRRGE